MPLLPQFEQYNGLPTIYENAGGWVDAEFEFTNRFSFSSSETNKITYVTSGVGGVLIRDTGDWGEDGFLAGDSITMNVSAYVGGGSVPFTFNDIVDYIDDERLYLVAGLPSVPSGTVFPEDGVVSGMFVVADKLPNAIEFYFNLTPNGGTNIGSVIDAEIQRFELQDADTLVFGLPVPMTQLGNKSGGYLQDVEISHILSSTNFFNRFKVTYKFWDWGIIKDGFSEPNYYDMADHLAPIIQVKTFSQYGNPNGVLTALTSNTEANTGGFNENYNGGTNLYTVISTEWKDALGNTITALDYSGNSTFTTVIIAPGQVNPTSKYRLGLAWRPIDGSVYQNLPQPIVNNLMVLAPENDFIADAVTDVTVYDGFPSPGIPSTAGSAGAQWDLTNVNIEITGVDELTVTGEIQPNAAAKALFDEVADGGRRSTLWLSIGDHTKDGTTNSTRVALTLFDEDNIDAPTLGVQIPNVISETLLDHGFNDILTPEPQTTTEDDVLYKSEVLLVDNVDYELVRVRFWAFNNATLDEFTLENIEFSFSSVVNIAGQFQPNFTQNRGFNLPPTTDRNAITLKRKPSLDIPGKYGIELQYGYLSRWEYWLSQSNVDNDFFDILESFNGKNKNWQRFYLPPDWKLRISYYTQVAGVQDFQHYDVGIRPYEDDPNITVSRQLTVLSTGATPTSLFDNELHQIQIDFTWAISVFTNPWVEFTIQDKEAGNRWVMSSVLDQGGIAANPFKPIAGETAIQLTGIGTNVLTCKALVDANLISVPNSSFSYRVYSDTDQIVDIYEPLMAYSVFKISFAYTGALMKLRRSSDNAELDFMADSSGIISLSSQDIGATTTLATWAGDSTIFVARWYNQGTVGATLDLIQVTLTDQPIIMQNTILVTDPDNGIVSMLYNGTSHHFTLANAWQPSPTITQIDIFNRASAGNKSVTLGDDTGINPFTTIWFNDNSTYFRPGVNAGVSFPLDMSTGDFLDFIIYASSSANLFRNNLGNAGNPAAYTLTGTLDVEHLGKRNTDFHNGHRQEFYIFDTDQTTNRAAIQNLINGRFNIY